MQHGDIACLMQQTRCEIRLATAHFMHKYDPVSYATVKYLLVLLWHSHFAPPAAALVGASLPVVWCLSAKGPIVDEPLPFLGAMFARAKYANIYCAYVMYISHNIYRHTERG